MTDSRSTTILCVRRGADLVIASDGQVTLGDNVVKTGAVKVRKLFDGAMLAGFAGSSADAFTLFERFEKKLDHYGGNLKRAAVELAKDWRTDKVLRRLEALLIAADSEYSLIISGNGDVIEPEGNAVAVGSGGGFALAAARALLAHTKLGAEEIATEAMRIAAGICIYTNETITIERLDLGG